MVLNNFQILLSINFFQFGVLVFWQTHGCYSLIECPFMYMSGQYMCERLPKYNWIINILGPRMIFVVHSFFFFCNFLKMKTKNQAWQYAPVVQLLGRLRQDHFSLGVQDHSGQHSETLFQKKNRKGILSFRSLQKQTVVLMFARSWTSSVSVRLPLQESKLPKVQAIDA